MDLFNWYFKQLVTAGDMNEGFEKAQEADHDMMSDQGLAGICVGGNASQHAPTADLTVDITAPIAAYDDDGQRIYIPGSAGIQNVDVSVDSNSVSTAVASGGNEKIVSIFVQFERLLSQSETDGNDNSVFFRKDENFKIIVEQSAEAASPTAPPLKTDAKLVCDITRTFGQSQILNANISVSRREKMFVLSTANFSINEGTQEEAIQAILQEFQNHIDGVGVKHAASVISYAPSATWADSTPLAATDLQAATEEIVSDLADNTSPDGASRIGSDQTTSTFFDSTTLAQGTIGGQVEELVSVIGANTGADKMGWQGGATWAESTVQGDDSVGDTLDDVIAKLADTSTHAASGARKIGLNADAAALWADSTGIAATNVGDGMDEVVTDLGGSSGAAKIGIDTAAMDVTGDDVAEVIDNIDSGFAKLDRQNTFSADQRIQAPGNLVLEKDSGGDGDEIFDRETTDLAGAQTNAVIATLAGGAIGAAGTLFFVGEIFAQRDSDKSKWQITKFAAGVDTDGAGPPTTFGTPSIDFYEIGGSGALNLLGGGGPLLIGAAALNINADSASGDVQLRVAAQQAGDGVTYVTKWRYLNITT